MLRICLVFVTVISFSAAAPADQGDITIAEDAKRKINLAGRQRMLTQRIAKSVCLAQIGIDVATNRDEIRKSTETFDAVLSGLRVGSFEYGMLEETDLDVLKELRRVKALWDPFRVFAHAASQGDIPRVSFETIHEQNIPLLTQMHSAVVALQDGKSVNSMGRDLAILINVSGKQRMLTQRTAKTLCMIVANVDPAADRAELKDSVLEFESSLKDLIDGNPGRGMLPAPTGDLQSQLDLIRTMWAKISPALHSIIEGAEPTKTVVARIAKDTEDILFEMNNAVWMYESL